MKIHLPDDMRDFLEKAMKNAVYDEYHRMNNLIDFSDEEFIVDEHKSSSGKRWYHISVSSSDRKYSTRARIVITEDFDVLFALRGSLADEEKFYFYDKDKKMIEGVVCDHTDYNEWATNQILPAIRYIMQIGGFLYGHGSIRGQKITNNKNHQGPELNDILRIEEIVLTMKDICCTRKEEPLKLGILRGAKSDKIYAHTLLGHDNSHYWLRAWYEEGDIIVIEAYDGTAMAETLKFRAKTHDIISVEFDNYAVYVDPEDKGNHKRWYFNNNDGKPPKYTFIESVLRNRV